MTTDNEQWPDYEPWSRSEMRWLQAVVLLWCAGIVGFVAAVVGYVA